MISASAIWARYLSTGQRRIVAGLALFMLAIAITGWIDAFRARQSANQYLREADQARREAKTALKAAAEIATKIKAAEKQLVELEEKRNEEFQKYDRGAGNVRDLRDRYDAARRERVGPDAANADELCGELAGLGYPCR
jgi:Flp pilus assembly protein TadB